MPAQPSSAHPSAPVTEGGSEPYSRLHITPFDADLLKTVVPAASLPKARNISFHTLETFPENRYGFIELPVADADKVKRKFHGSTLRGQKMRVEKARPEKILEPTADDVEEVSSKKRKKRSSDDRDGGSKKRKRDLNTVEGVMLPEGRKVKRGWTVTPEEARKEAKQKKRSKDKDDKEKKKSKKIVKSKYTDKEECLMKVVLPPNAPALVDANVDERRKRKKKGKAQREVVVHEFENTTKFPSFIKSTTQSTETKQTGPIPLPFDDPVPEPRKEKAKKELIKEEPQKTTKDDVPKKEEPKEEPGKVEPENDSDAASESSEDSNNDSSSDSSASESETEAVTVEPPSSESDSDSDSDSESEDEKDEPTSLANNTLLKPPADSSPTTRPRSSGSMKNLSITIPPPPTTPAKVHPLEALYKRTKTDDTTQSTPAAEPFSFFGGGGSDDEEEEEDSLPVPGSQPPMTPFTRQDFELRNVRSAAPTPDTAHPNRTRGFWGPSREDDINEEEEEAPTSPLRISPSREPAGAQEENKDNGPATDFQNWFYENRRDLNKSWMNRRKSAKKEKRQRENRARASRN
ncbi:hypothetical protein jhhlp_002676 [Lomentospora prolificans]|uniref:Uncharacterized protein n=1 Tax=Lomentospora prolificans TaxID=41688 RepID=A0A2N3NER2_9PEZI|nr:hypothetical protein jhhlp_002676 [Lomentospora prolificans]